MAVRKHKLVLQVPVTITLDGPRPDERTLEHFIKQEIGRDGGLFALLVDTAGAGSGVDPRDDNEVYSFEIKQGKPKRLK